MEKPEQLKEIDLTKVRKVCQDYIDFFGSDYYSEDDISDHEAWIVEAVMEAIFGDKVHEYINDKMD